MRHLFFSFVFLFSLMLNAQKVTPGISVDEFKKLNPGIIPDNVTYNESVSKAEQLGHFNGSWYFDFKRDTLRSVTYSCNLGSKPKGGYVKSYMAYYSLFNKDMGQPLRSIQTKDTVLCEDRKRVENTDTVVFASWNNKNTRIIMGIYFTGNRNVKTDPMDLAVQNMINAEAERNYYVFTIRCLPIKTEKAPDAWKFYPGMHVKEFSQVIPELFPNGVGINGQWSKDERLIGLSGDWAYQFKNSTLEWMMWNHYAGKYDQVTFNNMLRSVRGIIADYSKIYGTPKMVTDNAKYRDPMKDHHYGYEVLKAYWDKGTYDIEIVFDFMGGKGDYELLMKIEGHRK
jgi:hypothetical protein